MLSGLIYSLVYIRFFAVIPVKELADLELILGSIFFLSTMTTGVCCLICF